MGSNELLISINADAKNFEKKFDDLRDKTSDLEGQLNKLAVASGIAFAAFTAEIFFSVKAFEEAEKASRQLTNALQNQGVYTKELKQSYVGFAKAVQDKTGIDDDAIVKAQAVAQQYLGQIPITQELTNAIADLSATMNGDLNSAAEKIAKTIGTNINAFRREGLQIAETATEAERMAKVLEFVQLRAGGLAEEFNKADGYTKALQTAFGNFQELIGARFSPILAAARKAAAEFFQSLSENEFLGDLAAGFVAAGAAISGIVLAISLAVPAFLALSAAATTLGISLSLALVGIPIAIGAIVTAIFFVKRHWAEVFAFMNAAVVAFTTFVSEAFSGVGQVIAAALRFDPKAITSGVDKIKNSLATAKAAAIQTYDDVYAAGQEADEKQNVAKAKAAEKEAQKRREHQANLVAIEKATLEIIKLQNEDASAALIQIKQKELENLKALDQEKSDQEIALLKERRAKINELVLEQETEELQRDIQFAQLREETKLELAQQGIALDGEIAAARLAELRAQVKTEDDIDREVQEGIIKRRTDAQNQKLLDQKKYGIAYASINQALNSQELTSANNAAGNLASLAQSKNETLKGIGKAAAITQIGIDTAKGAMAVYANFQTAIPYPPVSIPLGIAAAAAITAYGGERIANVTAAADGGLIEGGIPGRDSVPVLAEPGELIVPKRNYNDVVGAVQNQNSGNADQLEVLRSIDNKFSQPSIHNFYGDILAEDTYVDKIIDRISDRIEFGNKKIFGVNT